MKERPTVFLECSVGFVLGGWGGVTEERRGLFVKGHLRVMKVHLR